MPVKYVAIIDTKENRARSDYLEPDIRTHWRIPVERYDLPMIGMMDVKSAALSSLGAKNLRSQDIRPSVLDYNDNVTIGKVTREKLLTTSELRGYKKAPTIESIPLIDTKGNDGYLGKTNIKRRIKTIYEIMGSQARTGKVLEFLDLVYRYHKKGGAIFLWPVLIDVAQVEAKAIEMDAQLVLIKDSRSRDECIDWQEKDFVSLPDSPIIDEIAKISKIKNKLGAIRENPKIKIDKDVDVQTLVRSLAYSQKRDTIKEGKSILSRLLIQLVPQEDHFHVSWCPQGYSQSRLFLIKCLSLTTQIVLKVTPSSKRDNCERELENYFKNNQSAFEVTLDTGSILAEENKHLPLPRIICNIWDKRTNIVGGERKEGFVAETQGWVALAYPYYGANMNVMENR